MKRLMYLSISILCLSVAYLAMNSVASSRTTTIGYGETQPVADNSTSAGRQTNRRVEVAIMANDKLKETAKKQGGLN